MIGNSRDRECFRKPVPEIYDSARYLDAAVSAHLNGKLEHASQLFDLANNDAVWEWTDSIWGANSPYVTINKIAGSEQQTKVKERMPSAQDKQRLHERDGFHCRYCGIPVIRPEIRKLIAAKYPVQVPWCRTNKSQHAAFQAMWAQYDHVVPHSHGGTNDLENLVVSCAACNFGKMSYTLSELGLLDPRNRAPVQSMWEGLERFGK